MVVVLFMGSVQRISLGIMGQYIRRMFLDSKERPPYMVGTILTTRAAHEPVSSPKPLRST